MQPPYISTWKISSLNLWLSGFPKGLVYIPFRKKEGLPEVTWTARFLLMKKGPALKSACRLYERIIFFGGKENSLLL